ncbi:MAG: hypothetical protein AB7I19_13900 [Planctomycetota bacterium]
MSKSNFFASLLHFLRRWQNTLFLFGVGFLMAWLPHACVLRLEEVMVA